MRAATEPIPIPDWIQRLFGVDLRSLALFRIALGAILIADLVIRAGDLTAFYTDDGVLPRARLIGEFGKSDWLYSLHLMSGGAPFQAAIFLIAGLAAFAMLTGYRTRIATAISFILLCSLQNRNPYVLQGGDALLRVMHFWILFLPAGARWSVDALRARQKPGGCWRPIGVTALSPNIVVSLGSAAALIQVGLMYWFTAGLKSDPIWWRDGLGVWYALSVDQFSTSLGQRLLEFPTLLKVLSRATFWIEAFGPFLAFVPFATARFRMAAVLLFVGFHFFGLRLTMELGLFQYTATAIWLIFIPSDFWDRWAPAILRRVRIRAQPWLEPLSAPPAAAEGPLRPLRLAAHAGIIGFLLIYAIAWNVRAADFNRYAGVFPRNLNWIGELTGLRQYWSMFAPRPMTDDGWWVFPAWQVDGDIVDLRTGQPVDYAKPNLVSATYKNQRWRKYLMNLRESQHQRHRAPLAPWLLDEWNRAHQGNDRAVALQMVYIEERTTADGTKPPRRLKLHEYHAGESQHLLSRNAPEI